MRRPITLPQAQALVRQLSAPQAFFAALQSAAIYFKGKVAIYPRDRHEAQPLKTAKGRRGFFAKLRAGEIEVPYRRGGSPGTQYMSRSWDTQTEAGGWAQRIGNRAGYSSIVQGEKQSFYHKVTGWKTIPQVWSEEKDSVGKVFFGHFRKLLGNLRL